MMNRLRRILLTLRMLPLSGAQRARLLKRHFRSIGQNTVYQTMSLPAEPHLVSIGSNVTIASGVTFVTHDVIGYLINDMTGTRQCTLRVGRIDIGDNVFIGTNSTILYDTAIGSNCVVAACSMVKGSVEAGNVYGGVPAKRLCSFEDLAEKYREYGSAAPWRGVRDGRAVKRLQEEYCFSSRQGAGTRDEGSNG